MFQTCTRHLLLVFLTVTLAVMFQTAHPVPVADAFVDINLVMFQTAHPTPVTCILTLTL